MPENNQKNGENIAAVARSTTASDPQLLCHFFLLFRSVFGVCA